MCKRHRVLLWYMVGMMPFLDSRLYSICSIFFICSSTLIILCIYRNSYPGSEVRMCYSFFFISTNFLYLRYTPICKYVTSKKMELLRNLEHKLCKNCWTIYITCVNIHNTQDFAFHCTFHFIHYCPILYVTLTLVSPFKSYLKLNFDVTS